MKFSMAVMRSLTEVKLPRRMAWRMMIEKKISTMLSQTEVGVKCRVILGFFASQARDVRVLVRAVVIRHDVQLAARVSASDLPEEPQDSSCRWRGWQASVTLPVATSSAANSVVVPCRM